MTCAHRRRPAPRTVEERGRAEAGGPQSTRKRGRARQAVRTAALLTLLGALSGLLVACGGHRSTGGARSGTAKQVEAVAGELADIGAHSVIVLVSDHGRTYLATRGAGATQRFRIGSVTKTFTATIVLELAAEGKLRLEDTMQRYLPGVVPAGGKITIRELLDHRSGLANYNIYPAWQERLNRSSSIRPIDALRFAASQPLDFPPGSDWGYSNTNYIALGLIIEAITRRAYGEQLQQRILTPLGLRNTELATTRAPRGLDDRGVNPNGPWAAGAIVSTAQDLARFFSALLAGEILPRAWLAKMKKTVSGINIGLPVDDGLGIFLTRAACGRFWGHDGLILNYATVVDARDDGSRVAVISARDRPPRQLDDSELLCREHTAAR
jgi:D-alanyl-D-alanine carboxypeptidase